VVVGVDNAAMDAYSRTVIAVAASVTPHVASVRTRRGSGSAVVFTDDGFLLTNAHVVGVASGGEVVFADGVESRFEVVGVDPLSDLAVLRARDGAPGRCRSGTATDWWSVSWWWRSAARSAWRVR
jgi:S1-C subfamily serine protease